MFNPPHPAATLREDVLPALGISVAEAAPQLGMSRVQLSRVIKVPSLNSVRILRVCVN